MTVGKRNKRSKTQGGENGDGRSSPEENDSELIVQAPEKLAKDNVRFKYLNSLKLYYIKFFY